MTRRQMLRYLHKLPGTYIYEDIDVYLFDSDGVWYCSKSHWRQTFRVVSEEDLAASKRLAVDYPSWYAAAENGDGNEIGGGEDDEDDESADNTTGGDEDKTPFERFRFLYSVYRFDCEVGHALVHWDVADEFHEYWDDLDSTYCTGEFQPWRDLEDEELMEYINCHKMLIS